MTKTGAAAEKAAKKADITMNVDHQVVVPLQTKTVSMPQDSPNRAHLADILSILSMTVTKETRDCLIFRLQGFFSVCLFVTLLFSFYLFIYLFFI